MSKNSLYNVPKLLIIGILFHVIYIASVFDCYFTSPVVHGMESYRLPRGEARRLVLIVGDGMRADLLYSKNAFPSVTDSPEVVGPYLRNIAETRGAFGVSHTHVPTESRPGHVALIAGMYEDVSAVTKGWKVNPVDFDSIFNQSSHTFSFGSPDILPMFAKGAVPGRVRTWTYDEDDEDFTKDATYLDTWVLDRLVELFANASSDAVLDSQLRSDQTVFFLHLLGLDTTGHSYKPHSKEYMDNMRIVDDIVRQTEELFTEFFKDEETAYVFTADHGMSVRGNHGDGDPDNTRTPLIAWGRGIRGPVADPSPSSHDEFSSSWGLSHLLRRDVEQADVAALMAAVIGIDWPVNSVGVLPDVDTSRPGYLLPRDGEETLALAALVNAQVILEHYRVKHELKQSHVIFYSPFQALERTDASGVSARRSAIVDIEQAIANRNWYLARQRSFELINITLEGLRYLQTYDRFLIQVIVTTGFLGWAAYSSLYILRPLESTTGAPTRNPTVSIVAASALILTWILFAVQHSPWTFYLYSAFPCYFWHQTISQLIEPMRALLKKQDLSYKQAGKTVLYAGLVVAVLQSMVVGYTNRYVWSIGLAVMGLAWPVLFWPREALVKNSLVCFGWAVTCLATAVFPLLSVDKEESRRTILSGASGMLVIGLIGLGVVTSQLQRRGKEGIESDTLSMLALQLLLVAGARYITDSSMKSLAAKQGLSTRDQVLGWVILVLASIIPFIWPADHGNALSRILSLFLAFSPCFIILSISVEGLFYIAYSLTLVFWIEMEAALRAHSLFQSKAADGKGPSSGVYYFRPDDLRIALFFLFFVQIAFFGTGNVASISSFYLQPVYRLVPIFNPFLMAALLIFKIVVPYIMLSASFAVLNSRLHLPPFSLFLIALALTDVMTMTFFYQVTDTGSWLEIGQSISFFCITSLLLVWSAGICAAGELLMAGIPITLDTVDTDKEKTE